ncbi:MAG: hypothetical protein RLY47_278 [Candidatus Parcubacteria bacterium]|jgi:hypothetical protein
MPLHTIAFASSLFLIALFFALKEREVYAGEATRFTRFLVKHSPAVESVWRRCGAWLDRTYHMLFARVVAFITNIGARIAVTFRYIVVLLADKMIKAVRGEKFLEMTGAPSMYLKHLKEHRDAKNRDRDESTPSMPL